MTRQDSTGYRFEGPDGSDGTTVRTMIRRPAQKKPRKEPVQTNALSRLIFRRKTELGLTWDDIAARGEFSSHTIVHALANKAEHKSPPRLSTLQRLSKALDVPLEQVKQAAAEAAGFQVTEFSEGDVRVVVSAMQEMSERDRQKIIRLAQEFAAEARGDAT